MTRNVILVLLLSCGGGVEEACVAAVCDAWCGVQGGTGECVWDEEAGAERCDCDDG